MVLYPKFNYITGKIERVHEFHSPLEFDQFQWTSADFSVWKWPRKQKQSFFHRIINKAQAVIPAQFNNNVIDFASYRKDRV